MRVRQIGRRGSGPPDASSELGAVVAGARAQVNNIKGQVAATGLSDPVLFKF